MLKRLLKLNHTIHEEELEKGLWDRKGKKGKGKEYNINEENKLNNIASEPTEGLWGQM